MTRQFGNWGLVFVALASSACGNNSDAGGGMMSNGGGGASSNGLSGGAANVNGGAGSGSSGGAAQGGISGMGGASTNNAGTAGTTGTSGRAGDGGVSGAVQALTPTINAFCAAARICCAQQGQAAMLDDCESMFAAHNATVASVASGAITVDSVALAACVAAYQQAATACEENPVLSACQNVYVGMRAENEACSNGQECKRDQGPMTCLFTSQNGTSGTCKPVPHGKSGDGCVSSCGIGEDCSSSTYGEASSTLALCFEQDGLYCDNTDGNVCKPLLALGAPCSGFASCGTANYCDTTCTHAGTLGEDCTSSECLESLECTNGTCQSPPFSIGGVCMGYSLGP